jgi:mycofactocin glycosyltransferase
VDDNSHDAESIGAIADRHGAKLLRRNENGGPGAARNTGLDHVPGDYVAFIDSDCTPPRGGWLHTLAGHFADPAVAAVAARVVAGDASSWAARYGKSQSSLDLGDQPARVLPGARIAYVPTAAVVARCSALRSVAVDGEIFDPALRVGEDVDLIWRLHQAGWRIRYDPSAVVEHAEPTDWRSLLARRFKYGTSAAPLAKRHGAAVAPFAIHPWPTLVVAAAVTRRPVLAAAAFAASVATTSRTLRAADVPTRGVVSASAEGVRQTWLGLGRYAVQLLAPLLVLAGLRRRWRAGVASLVLGPPLVAWAGQWRRLDPVRFVLGWLADQLAYGAGVWRGCVGHRTTIPLRPVLARRTVRTEVDRAPSGRGV